MTPLGIEGRINNSSSFVGGESLRVNLNSNLCRWFSRNLGLWRSRRKYIFDDNESLSVDMIIRIDIYDTCINGEPRYRFKWWAEKEYDFFEKKSQYKKEGIMDATLSGHQLLRNSFYFSESSGISTIRQIDEHEVIFDSNYESWNILEHTRLIDQDRYRSRVIYSWENNQLKIVEHHHEIRLEWAGNPLKLNP